MVCMYTLHLSTCTFTCRSAFLDHKCDFDMSGKRIDLTRLVVVSLWAALACLQIQRLSADPTPCPNSVECRVENPADGCGCNQYSDEGQNVCVDCVNCCSRGQAEAAPCTTYSDTMCCEPGVQYFNSATSQCENCTICKSNEQKVAECTITEDTQCQPRCHPHQYYAEGQCFFNCELCEYGCVTTGTARCRCYPTNCFSDTDLLCGNNLCAAMGTTSVEITGTVDNEPNGLPTWGIGLISIGVVIGIVAFSAGSLILSFCTKKTSQIEEDVEAENLPKSVLPGRYVTGHPSPFLHHYRHPGDPRYSPNSPRTNSLRNSSVRANSIRTSPKAPRVMPAPRVENATPI